MEITVIAVGKLTETYLAEGVAAYTARLNARHRFRLCETADERAPENLSPSGRQAVLEKEGARILPLIPPNAAVSVLAVEGRPLRDDSFRKLLSAQEPLAFIIGGSLGLSARVKARGDYLVSFSPLTFPHQLTRLLFMEELYRLL